MKTYLLACLSFVVVLSLVGITTVDGSTIYSGSLSTSDGGLVGGGNWEDDSSLTWTIAQEGSVWHYTYNLVVPAQGISHIIIEVSCNFTIEDVFNATGPFEGIEIGDFNYTNGNPGIPGSVHGLKFDGTSGIDLTIEFDSHRMPVWGDFYAKDGKVPGSHVDNVIWNAGFPAADPLVPAHNGQEANHLLVPDTIIPEPSTMVMLIAGLITGCLYLLHRKT